MGGVAPRFLFLLATPFPLLRRHHHHHHHRNLFLLSTHSLHLSSSPSPLPLKLKASQSQASSFSSSSWPEWSSFLSHISSAGYLPSLPDQTFTAAAERLSYSFLRDATAFLAFARDRPNLLRLLSTRDIAAVVEHGSPFLFRDADDSVRKMKSFLSNGDANVLDTDRANTVDLMKFLLSYASNPFFSSEGNSLNKRDLVESSVRNLFGELFKLNYSAPGPNAFDSVQSQMAGRFGQTKPPGQKIEMKRGDWLCPRCNFMNFARNIKCLECEEARPKRQLAGGEWECPQCDFYNYGRNMTCLRCDCKRPGQISLCATNTMSNMGYENGNNPNTSDIDARLAANEEKAQRWFSKVSQLDSSADINSVMADEDFPEIMPLRKGVNRFVVSTRKTPLERRLANAQYKRNLSNNDIPGIEDSKAGEPIKSHDNLDEMLRRSYTSTVPPIPLSADALSQKSENLLAEESKKRLAAMEQSGKTNFVPFVPFPPDYFAKKDKQQEDGTDSSVADATALTDRADDDTSFISEVSGRAEWIRKSLEGSAVKEPDPLDMSEEAKAERWFRRIAQIKDISELSQIPDEDFPSIMPMRKGVNRFVVSKRKTPLERRLTDKLRSGMKKCSTLPPWFQFKIVFFIKKNVNQIELSQIQWRENNNGVQKAASRYQIILVGVAVAVVAIGLGAVYLYSSKKRKGQSLYVKKVQYTQPLVCSNLGKDAQEFYCVKELKNLHSVSQDKVEVVKEIFLADKIKNKWVVFSNRKTLFPRTTKKRGRRSGTIICSSNNNNNNT
ncbi:hypothetical protein JHK87_053285 [Glycine soja]|nr:hypothetical protein JHK87_053285 [Glycine soja]